MSKIISYFRSADGASATEYAILAAILGLAFAAAAILLGPAIHAALNRANTCIDGSSSTPCMS